MENTQRIEPATSADTKSIATAVVPQLRSGYALPPSRDHGDVSSRLTLNLILFVAQH
jgi:hypothetical protein